MSRVTKPLAQPVFKGRPCSSVVKLEYDELSPLLHCRASARFVWLSVVSRASAIGVAKEAREWAGPMARLESSLVYYDFRSP